MSAHSQHDFVVVCAGSEAPMNYAGLVLEMLGYSRWTTRPTWAFPQGGSVTIGSWQDQSELPNSDGRFMLEVLNGAAVPFPLELDFEPALLQACKPSLGLYTHLDNYNGIRGIRLPLRVDLPITIARQQPREPLGASTIATTWQSPSTAVIVDGEPLVWLRDGRTVIARRDNVLLLGLPLLSILASHLTAAHYPAASYSFSEPVHHLLLLMQALIERTSSPGTVRVAPWPSDGPGVVSVRHDYDRRADLVETAKKESQLGLRSSIYILPDLLPTNDQVEELAKLGCEFGLHTRRLHQIEQERDIVASAIGQEVLGNCAHGGAGADGWHGLPNLLAAHRAGFLYTELLSEMHIWPHRIPDLAHPGFALAPLALPHHLSFDVDRKQHDAERLRLEMPALVRTKAHVTIMNHPDLHRETFIEFLREALPAGMINMTLAETARWWRATHTAHCFDVAVTCAANKLRIHGRATQSQHKAVLFVRLPPECETLESLGNVECTIVNEGAAPYARLTLTRDSVHGFEVVIS